MEVLKNKIVLDPQWIIDALKSLITAEMFVHRSYPAICDKWIEFKKNGKLSPELIDAIWTQEKNLDFHINKEHILTLMEHLHIIARLRLYDEDTKEEMYFLAPCMLRQKTPKEVICPELHPQMESSSVLCCVFTEKFLPSPIFHRLLSACVAHWPLATKKTENMVENLIYCGCGVFQLDQYHQLILHFKQYVIFVRLTRFGIKDKTVSSKLCIEVREFITTSLHKIIGHQDQNLHFELYIQCPEYNGDSVNSLIPVSLLIENTEVRCDFHSNIIESHSLLHFWFEDQEFRDAGSSSAGPMPPPSTSDADRFMRIAYLLVDVGSQVLRHLMRRHTVTSTSTLDQYLANNRNIINSLVRKKVLNISQMDILFPPNGGSTDLEEYDITLLSALFNNIVPSLSQQEKSMIQALREERNTVYGHAKSCKVNASDYQTYYNSISSTLITLSQQCGNSNFENQIMLEIRRAHFAAIPAESYLDKLNT